MLLDPSKFVGISVFESRFNPLLQGAVIIKPTTGRLQEVFGNYQTIKKLGSGTFGEVYLGVDLASNRQVAIKLESVQAQVPMLKLESQMYAKLQGSAGVPVMKV